jgi:hypothetical protein
MYEVLLNPFEVENKPELYTKRVSKHTPPRLQKQINSWGTGKE